MKCFLLYLTTLLFLLPAIVFSEENPNPEMELGGNLFLINRDHPIGKDYYPRDLVEPKVLGGGEATRMRPEAAAALEELFAAAKEEGLFLAAVSGYRSYGQQASIFDRKLQKVDRQTAQRTVAPPGCSEHQLGLAMDLGTKKEIRLTAAFGETFQQYVFRLRMEKASALLAENRMSVAEVAAAVGMEYHHFCKRFRHYSRMTPTEYRRRQGETK